MKSFLLSFSLIALVFFACTKTDTPEANACLPSNLTTGLIACYTFGNGSIADGTIYGNDLSNSTNAAASMDRAGNPNCAFEFDNLPTSVNTQYLTTASTGFLNGLNAFSISLWYQPMDTTRDAGAFETLISRDKGFHCPDTDGQWSLGLYDCRRAVFGLKNSVWEQQPPTAGCNPAADGVTGLWNHVVITYSEANNTLELYKNGVLHGSVTGTANCQVAPTVQDIGDLFIGNNYTGKIDDIFIYDRILSPTEVGQLNALAACCL
ncbi:MAG: LamG domain-containing protein [Saprospiraceae bacterium]